MVGHGGSSAGSYLADPTSPIPSQCASIVVTSTLKPQAESLLFAAVLLLMQPIQIEEVDRVFQIGGLRVNVQRTHYRHTFITLHPSLKVQPAADMIHGYHREQPSWVATVTTTSSYPQFSAEQWWETTNHHAVFDKRAGIHHKSPFFTLIVSVAYFSAKCKTLVQSANCNFCLFVCLYTCCNNVPTTLYYGRCGLSF